jgi:hypothetical protein
MVLLQVCLDYWNALVSELFEAHHSSDNPAATANAMGLQVNHTRCDYPDIIPFLSYSLSQDNSDLKRRRRI